MNFFDFSNFQKKQNALTNTIIYGVFLFLTFVRPDGVVAQRTIKGTVTDIRNSPLIGSTIVAVGFAKGAVADVEGKFSMEIPNQCQEIEISYVGYKTQKVALDSRTFYSISLQNEKREKNSPSNTPNNNKKEKEDTPLRKISRLFGVSAQAGYLQQNGTHKFPLEGSLGSISKIDYGFSELNARFSIVALGFELSKTFTAKNFTNKYVQNVKYDNTELNFDGLPLLFTKKDGSNAGGYGTFFYSMILPNFSWKKIVAENYLQKSFSTNFFYGLMGYEKESFKIDYAPISISGNTIYGGIEYHYNRFNYLKMTGLLERIPRMFYNMSRFSRKLGINEKDFDYNKENPAFRIFKFVPVPCVDIYSQNGRFTYFDNKGTPIFDEKLGKGFGWSFALVYQPYFRIKKLNCWILPNIKWLIYDETGKVESANSQPQQTDPIFQFQHKYLRAGISLQLML